MALCSLEPVLYLIHTVSLSVETLLVFCLGFIVHCFHFTGFNLNVGIFFVNKRQISKKGKCFRPSFNLAQLTAVGRRTERRPGIIYIWRLFTLHFLPGSNPSGFIYCSACKQIAFPAWRHHIGGNPRCRPLIYCSLPWVHWSVIHPDDMPDWCRQISVKKECLFSYAPWAKTSSHTQKPPDYISVCMYALVCKHRRCRATAGECGIGLFSMLSILCVTCFLLNKMCAFSN